MKSDQSRWTAVLQEEGSGADTQTPKERTLCEAETEELQLPVKKCQGEPANPADEKLEEMMRDSVLQVSEQVWSCQHLHSYF